MNPRDANVPLAHHKASNHNILSKSATIRAFACHGHLMISIDKAGELLGVLDLESIETNWFRGRNESRQGARLFGGQVLAQALAAGANTVDGTRPCHSLHAYFLRPGDSTTPVLYSVDRIRDGRSFTTRRIVAIQNGEAIFSMDVSFHIDETGLTHQMDMPDLPMPESLEDDMQVAKRMSEQHSMPGWSTRERPFDLRSVYPIDQKRPDNNMNPVWLRFRRPLPNDIFLHQCLLAYASDMGLVSTSMLPHRKAVDRREVQMASLDHALWFHRDFAADDWILYIKETTTAAASRGYNRGAFYTRDGALIASTLQEGLMRVRS